MRLPTEEIRLEIGSQVRARKTFASGQVFEGATGTVVDWQIRTSHSNVRWPIVEWHHLSSSFLTPVGSGEMWIDWNNHCNIGFGCPLALVAAAAGPDVENVAGLLLMRSSGEEKKDATEGEGKEKQEEDALLLTSLDATANGRVLSDTIDILSSVQDVRHVALLACKLSNSLFFQSEEASEPAAEATDAAPPPPPPAQQTSSPPSSPKRRVRRKRKRSDSVKNEDGVDAAAAVATGGDGDW